MNVKPQESYHKQVLRIIESAIETGNFELAQTYINESAEFDKDFAMACQALYDEAWASGHPTELAVY